MWRRGWDLNPRGPEGPQALRQFALFPGLLPTWLGYPGIHVIEFIQAWIAIIGFQET